jgi:hypothetical protein
MTHRGTAVEKSKEYGDAAMMCPLFTRWRSLIAAPPLRRAKNTATPR